VIRNEGGELDLRKARLPRLQSMRASTCMAGTRMPGSVGKSPAGPLGGIQGRSGTPPRLECGLGSGDFIAKRHRSRASLGPCGAHSGEAHS
jgi:hypothetical protein